jgi:hypothetical protein
VVRAYDIRSESDDSNESSATIADSDPPAGPTNFSYRLNGTRVDFSWTISTDDPSSGQGDNDVTGYDLYVTNGLGGPPLEPPMDSSISAGQSSKSLDTLYTTFGIKAVDRCGNTSGLVTPATCPSPLTVTISSPASGALVSGGETISGLAGSSNTITVVKVRIDTGPWEQATGTDNWSYTWDTTTVSNGAHIISISALDSGTCSGSTSLSVTVQH